MDGPSIARSGYGRKNRDAAPDLTNAGYMGHDLGVEFHRAFAVRAQRAYFDAQPPDLQHETMARINRIIVERPNSYLARHWRAMYADPSIVVPDRMRAMLGVQ